MSLETWKAEFYPVAADKASKDDALAHSLRKWIGLRPENLRRHKLTSRAAVVSGRNRYFGIDDDSCALCFHFRTEDCYACPLYAVHNCECWAGPVSPYGAFKDRNNPEPMIAFIEAAIKEAK